MCDGPERARQTGLVEETDRGRTGAAGHPEEQQDSHHESPIADAVGNECFLRRGRCFFLVDVVAD